MAGPGTARKFDYDVGYYEKQEPSSYLSLVETSSEEILYVSAKLRSFFAFMRLFIAMLLVGVGIALVVMLSSYLMIFHSVKAEGIGKGSVVKQISTMKKYADTINIYDIGKTYYPVTVKVER